MNIVFWRHAPPCHSSSAPGGGVTAGAFDCFLVKGQVVAYGLRLVLGEVRMPGADRFPLDFALALGNDMVMVCYPQFGSYCRVAKIESRCVFLNLDGC